MPDLPEAVRSSVEAHKPGDMPPFADLLRSRSRQRRLRIGLAAASAALVLAVPAIAIPLAGDDSGEELAGPPGTAVTVRFAVSYDATADEDGAALEKCVALPGVGNVVSVESFPPQVTVPVTGPAAQTQAVRACLEDMPAVASVRELHAPTPAAGGPGAVLSSSGVTVVRVCPAADTSTSSCRLVKDRARIEVLRGLLQDGRTAERTCPRPGRQLRVELDPVGDVHVDECGNATEGATRFAVRPEAVTAVAGVLDAPVELRTRLFVTADPATPVAPCAELPGVTALLGSVSGSRPAEPATSTLSFAGSIAEKDAVLACLRALQGALVSEAGAPVPVRWTVGSPTRPTDRSVWLRFQEQTCSGASAPDGRVSSTITYRAREIIVSLAVVPVGTARCPVTSPTSYVVTLSEPIGNRTLVDGNAR